jgi:hypothetical protein
VITISAAVLREVEKEYNGMTPAARTKLMRKNAKAIREVFPSKEYVSASFLVGMIAGAEIGRRMAEIQKLDEMVGIKPSRKKETK